MTERKTKITFALKSSIPLIWNDAVPIYETAHKNRIVLFQIKETDHLPQEPQETFSPTGTSVAI